MLHGNKTPAHVHEGEGILGRLYSIYHHIVYWAGPNPHWRILTRLLVVAAWLGVLWAILGDAALPKKSKSEDYINCVRLAVNDSDPCNETDSDDFSILGMFHSNTDNITVGYSYVNCCVNQINFVIREGSMTESQVFNVFDNATHPPVAEEHGSIVTKEGQVFALVILLMASALGGFIARALRLPSLFGMLVVGIMLRNIDGIAVAKDIDHDLASLIRNVALVIILTRGGLSLNADALRKLKFGIARLAFLPCLSEGIIDGIVGHFLLDLPWEWSFMLGFVISAISPSILVPGLLNLQEHGFGTNKGIPSLLIASATLDDVISISLFGILLGFIFSTASIVFTIFRGPLEIIMGLVYGIVFGLICWQVPHRHDMGKGTRNRNRLAIITGLSLFGYFGAKRTEVYGTGFLAAGPLSVVIVSFVASIGWKRGGKTLVGRSLVIVWKFLQPLLFGLIGTEVDFSAITGDLLAKGVGVILIGAVVRVVAVSIAVQGNKLNLKEVIFVMIAWLPKATVQAAIGSAALDQAMSDEEQDFGRIVLTVAVLDIMIFGPLGALSIGLFGPHLLTQEGHHHVHIEHNIEGEVDITGNIESGSESESSDDEEYETGDDPPHESLSKHVADIQQSSSYEVANFHRCIDCDRLQDRLKIDCFRQMIEHEYVINKYIHSDLHHRSGHSSESQSYMSIEEDRESDDSPTPAANNADLTSAQLIEKKTHGHRHHSHHGHHHGHHHGKHGSFSREIHSRDHSFQSCDHSFHSRDHSFQSATHNIQVEVETSFNHPSSVSMNHPSSASMNHPSSASMNYCSSAPVNHPSSASMNHPSSASINHPSSASMNQRSSTSINHPSSASMNHPSFSSMNHPSSVMMNHTQESHDVVAFTIGQSTEV